MTKRFLYHWAVQLHCFILHHIDLQCAKAPRRDGYDKAFSLQDRLCCRKRKFYDHIACDPKHRLRQQSMTNIFSSVGHTISLHCIAIYYGILYCIAFALHSSNMANDQEHHLQTTKRDLAFFSQRSTVPLNCMALHCIALQVSKIPCRDETMQSVFSQKRTLPPFYKQNYIIKGCSKKKKHGIAWRAPDMKRSRHKIFTSFYSVPEHQNQLYAQKQGLDGMASGRP